ncbi:hypothetical protein [Lacticaseibacillus paracasei]|uniref:hypothetical protein n=1 Tax=Lacticaseibacillus paracasei TaxID=1597 RepID=UPI002FFBB9D0
MNYETKRNVFERALTEWDDYVHSWGLQGEEAHGGCEFDPILIKYMKDYDAALPDDLPVIPEAVGRMITKMKPTCNSILGSQYRDYGKDHRWIINHYDTFARAWVLGVWRVEETGEIVKLEAEK